MNCIIHSCLFISMATKEYPHSESTLATVQQPTNQLIGMIVHMFLIQKRDIHGFVCSVYMPLIFQVMMFQIKW